MVWPEEGPHRQHPSMRTTFTTHKGVRICVLDFSNITSEAEALRAIDEAKTIIGNEPQVLEQMKVDPALSDLPVVGVTAIQGVILRGIVQVTRRRLVAKNTRAEAMEWLANEAKLDSTKR